MKCQSDNGAAIRRMPIQRHAHPKRDQNDNSNNELGEDAIAAHFAFAFSLNHFDGSPIA